MPEIELFVQHQKHVVLHQRVHLRGAEGVARSVPNRTHHVTTSVASVEATRNAVTHMRVVCGS
eukprot:289558-Rhodomonas_salina.2